MNNLPEIVTRCCVCGKQRQRCKACDSSGIVSEGRTLRTCRACGGTGHEWIRPCFSDQTCVEYGLKVSHGYCPGCHEQAMEQARGMTDGK